MRWLGSLWSAGLDHRSSGDFGGDPVAGAVADRVFDEHRGRLFGVAYRVLGRVSDAEDVVQEAWLRWNGVNADEVADSEGYLVRVTTRLAIDRLRSAQVRRESYVGPWLPEPMLTSPDIADDVALADSVSTAMLLVMESLSPLERAVFVLHEAFGYSYSEIGKFVGCSAASARQTARRAREHVEERRTRYDTDQATRRRVTETFLAACVGGDLHELLAVLAPEVTLVCDGGGLAPAPHRVIQGMDHVARLLVLFAGRSAGLTTQVVDLNGGPGIIVRQDDVPVAAISFHLVADAIETIHLVSNPEKLSGLT
jgi:RNA polymerase sigma-70 factor (ECF subfamily)